MKQAAKQPARELARLYQYSMINTRKQVAHTPRVVIPFGSCNVHPQIIFELHWLCGCHWQALDVPARTKKTSRYGSSHNDAPWRLKG